MQWVAKAVQYYKDINPATLTGAIDVIVVERTNDAGDVELACSPFHVRFGKLSVLRPIDKKVRITVNGQSIPFYMKVGETGEAFFVFETDADLPEDLQTSPLSGPVGDDEMNEDPLAGGAPREPEFLDLGASQTSDQSPDPARQTRQDRYSMSSAASSSPGTSRYASMNATRLNSPTMGTLSLRPLTSISTSVDEAGGPHGTSPSKSTGSHSAFITAAEHVSSISRAAITSLSGNRKLADLEAPLDDEDHTARFGHNSQEFGELERRMREDLEGVQLDDQIEKNGADVTGSHIRRAAREHEADVHHVLGPQRSSSFGGTEMHALDSDTVPGAPEMTGDLMLDMSGYKMDGQDIDDAAETTEHILAHQLHDDNSLTSEQAEKEMLEFTQGLLQSADPKTLTEFFGPTDGAESPRASSPSPLDDDLQQKTPEFDLEAGLVQASSKQFTLKTASQVHLFELSLGGGPDFGTDRVRDEQSFIDHQVTFSQFIEHDDITDHSNLVVNYGGRYLTWDNASPVLASLAVYRKSLVDHPEHHNLGISAASKRSSKGWGSWWSRKGASTTSLPVLSADASTSPPLSPAHSRPASPVVTPVIAGDLFEPLEPLEPGAATDTRHYAKTLRLTSDQLKTLGLKKGKNDISFSVRSSYSGFATCTSRVFLWESDYHVVISDIDGTITKSDALGHVFTMIGRDWTHIGVAKLYTDIARNGYKMMYLTSRAIGQADTTREYLRGIKQNGYQLPEGPVIMSPDRLMTSLHREVIMRKPEVFKMACLRDIHRLFNQRSPFFAGFGNRITDALSYRSVDIPSSRIFTIDTNGEVKMELLELAGYKSSYIHMTDLVDQMFPPINRKTAPDYTDFSFWRAPVTTHYELPDLSPPSPALSARSDSSRLGLGRLGNIASSLSRRSSRAALTEPPPLRGSRVGRAATPSSPLLQATLVEEDRYDQDDENERSESEDMPGSLPQNDFDRYRAAVERDNRSQGQYAQTGTDLESGNVDDDDPYEEPTADEEADDLNEELDFTSVPYL